MCYNKMCIRDRLTTIHSNSSEATYRRMVSLCKRAVDMSDQTLMDYVTEAYPIVVFCKQLENKQRRMMEIQECEILPDGTRHYRPDVYKRQILFRANGFVSAESGSTFPHYLIFY